MNTFHNCVVCGNKFCRRDTNCKSRSADNFKPKYCSLTCKYKNRTGKKMFDGWSRKYDNCVVCHSTDKKYQALGMCSSCYKKSVSHKYPESVKRYKKSEKGIAATKLKNKRWYDKHGKEYNRMYRKNNSDHINETIRKRMHEHGYSYVSKASSEHVRRTVKRVTDITPFFLISLKESTKKCQLCGIKMTNDRTYPTCKHLDHIIPVSRGGLHIVSNVRYICARCNISRGNRYTV